MADERNRISVLGARLPPLGRPVSSLPPPRPNRPRVELEPQRSESPAPFSVSGKGMRLSWRALKPFLPWFGLVLFGSTGFVTAWWLAIKAHAVMMAAINARSIAAQADNAAMREELVAFKAQTNSRVAELVNAWKVEAAQNREERATRDREIEQLQATVPKIQGLKK